VETSSKQLAMPTTDWEAVEVLARIRWPDGFRCRFSHARHRRIQIRPRVFACKACGHQTSVTAGTALGRTRIPLKNWFLAASLICRPGGCSAAELQRRIGTCSETAWKLMHRLREAMDDPGVRLTDEPMVSGTGVDLPGSGQRPTTSGSSPATAQYRRVEGSLPPSTQTPCSATPSGPTPLTRTFCE